MKRIGALVITAFLCAVLLAGCKAVEPAPTGTAAEIADNVFATAEVQSFGMSQPLASDQDIEFFLGATDYPAFADAVVVQPMISIDTRMLYIIRAATQSDVATIKTKLEENIDPDRLICVTFSLEDVVIDSRGDVIFMIINSNADQRNALAGAFKTID